MRDNNAVKINRLKAERVIRGLESRNMHGYYAETKEDALKKALELIPEGSSVGYGGSMTLDEIGLKTALDEGNYTLIRRELAKNAEETREKYNQIYAADVYITSSNAVSEDGVIVNIDDTVYRARNVAATINNARLNLDNPCQKIGFCADCKSPNTICCQFLITRFSRVPDRIHVIIVNDDLGY